MSGSSNDTNHGRTDIHLRIFATAFILTSILFICERTLYYNLQNIDCVQFFGRILVSDQETHNGYTYMYAFSPMRSQNGLDTYYGTDFNAALFIGKRLLLLSADVELNPGPTNEDTELLLNAIKTSENRLLGEIRSVKDDIAIIKTEIATVKEECVKTKLDVNKIKEEQLQTKQSMKCMNKDIKSLYDLREQMQLDIDQLNEDFQNKVDMMDKIDQDIDTLDARSRKDTIRIFGLEEVEQESYNDLRRNIVDQVFKIADPEESWETDDIKRAFRAGEPKNGKPRMVIMKFRYDDDKHRIFKGRDALRDRGIRVGNDLTRRQREKLDEVKVRGQLGYFYNGKLHLYDDEPPEKPAHKRRRLHEAQNSDQMIIDEHDDTPLGPDDPNPDQNSYTI